VHAQHARLLREPLSIDPRGHGHPPPSRHPRRPPRGRGL